MAAPVSPFLQAISVGAQNNKTTLAGTATAVAYYGATNGLVLPSTKQEWLNFLVALLLQVIGLLAKDASTGSAPPAKA